MKTRLASSIRSTLGSEKGLGTLNSIGRAFGLGGQDHTVGDVVDGGYNRIHSLLYTGED